MKNKVNFRWLLIILPIIFFVWFLINKSDQKPLRILPYFGKKKYNVTFLDTTYHTVKPFCFKNQFNDLKY